MNISVALTHRPSSLLARNTMALPLHEALREAGMDDVCIKDETSETKEAKEPDWDDRITPRNKSYAADLKSDGPEISRILYRLTVSTPAIG